KKTRTYQEINQKIRNGEAVVLTAEDVSKLSPAEIVEKVDIVTTATFGPMCSSGAFINFGHADPPIRMEEVTLNDVPVMAGLAAVDSYIGAASESKYDNKYGGANVIEDLIAGKDVKLKARAKGTDCYPNKSVETIINKDNVNEFFLFNPRNAYQNYSVAVNTTKKIKHTYMGSLLPNLGNANYSTSGELSPLLNDPEMRTIGIGTRIFLCGAQGFVSWTGTQFNTSKEKNQFGVPIGNSATLSLIGDAKQMDSEFIKAAYFEKYGVTIFIGIGIPIPILDEDIAKRVCIKNSQINAAVVDYGTKGQPQLDIVNYEQLQSGTITVNGKKLKTASMSSIPKARKIAELLKSQIQNGEFFITEKVQAFPENTITKPLNQKKS
ncbi:MAG: homocysteine biosynthesis protein, partial [Bacteroidota bacterium]|nr:homocysteine biosynthesis protein [Bacteroidota bacterium]